MAVVACLVLSFALGPAAGLMHVGCVASAWAYNLGLKATVWSWVPYAVSFGGLTAVVTLADGEAPPWWWPVGAALLGRGRPPPQRAARPRRTTPPRACAGSPTASARDASLPSPPSSSSWRPPVVLVGAAPPLAATVAVAVVVLALAVVVVAGTGRLPFVAAVGIALVDALLLVVAR